MNELRAIPGHEGFYSVTADGRVWSHDRFRQRANGQPVAIKGKWLSAPLVGGYPRVCVTRDGVDRRLPVHRLVALAWLENPESKPFVNHINGVKTDNRAENLEWVTAQENTVHGWRTGLMKVSERQRAWGQALHALGDRKRKVDVDQYKNIYAAHFSGLSQRVVGEHFGISQRRVSQIVAIVRAAIRAASRTGDAGGGAT